MKKLFLFLVLLLSPLCFGQTNVFLITIENGIPKVEKESIGKDETKVYICGGESGIISVVFPTSPGLSGDFVKLADKKILIVRNVNDELVFSLKKDDGTLKEIIKAPINTLTQNDYKINLVSKNLRKAFKISAYETISEDNDSPVMNMFGDKITPQENEFIITTEIKAAASGFLEGGTSNLQFTGNYFLTDVKIGDKICCFVLDLAATNSMIVKNKIPAGIKTELLTAQQYSADGTQVVDAPSSGFGGNIQNLKTCTLPEVNLGSVSLKEKYFVVIDSLFKIKDMEIDGILGIDVLQKFEAVSFKIDTIKQVDLLLGSNYSKNTGSTINMPFTITNGHIFVKGKIGNSDVNFIVDTGSPFSFIQTKLAEKENITGEKSVEVKGADGKKISTLHGEISSLYLNDNIIHNFKTKIVDSPLLNNLGMKEYAGLLGNSFLKEYKEISINFKENKIFLAK